MKLILLKVAEHWKIVQASERGLPSNPAVAAYRYRAALVLQTQQALVIATSSPPFCTVGASCTVLSVFSSESFSMLLMSGAKLERGAVCCDPKSVDTLNLLCYPSEIGRAHV